jgi:hypothetical protein
MAEIVSCPACSKTLQVPEDFFGKTVQCPECKQAFLAQPTAAAAGSAAAPAYTSNTNLFPAPTESRRQRDDRERDDDERDLPRKRRPERDDEDDDRPRRRLTEHRGGIVLAFGIIAITGIMPIPFAPIAWLLGNADLREMRAGRMDPSGEGLTNVGRILGMISTLLMVVTLALVCVGFIFMVLLGIVGAAHG